MASQIGRVLFGVLISIFVWSGPPVRATRCQSEVIFARGGGGGGGYDWDLISRFEAYVRDSRGQGINGYCDSCSNTNNFCVTLRLKGQIQIIGAPTNGGSGYGGYPCSRGSCGYPWYNRARRHHGYPFGHSGYGSVTVSELTYKSCDFGLIVQQYDGQWHGWICEMLTNTQSYHRREPVCHRGDSWRWYNRGYNPLTQCPPMPWLSRSKRQFSYPSSATRPAYTCSRYPSDPQCRPRPKHCQTRTYLPGCRPQPDYCNQYPYNPIAQPSNGYCRECPEDPICNTITFGRQPYYPPPPPPPQPGIPAGCTVCFDWPNVQNVRFATPSLISHGYHTSLQPGIQMWLMQGSIQIYCCSVSGCGSGGNSYSTSYGPPPPASWNAFRQPYGQCHRSAPFPFGTHSRWYSVPQYSLPNPNSTAESMEDFDQLDLSFPKKERERGPDPFGPYPHFNPQSSFLNPHFGPSLPTEFNAPYDPNIQPTFSQQFGPSNGDFGAPNFGPFDPEDGDKFNFWPEGPFDPDPNVNMPPPPQPPQPPPLPPTPAPRPPAPPVPPTPPQFSPRPPPPPPLPPTPNARGGQKPANSKPNNPKPIGANGPNPVDKYDHDSLIPVSRNRVDRSTIIETEKKL